MLRSVLFIGRLRSSATVMVVGVAVLLLVAALSATSDSAVEVGQGWVPGARQPPAAQQTETLARSDSYEAPPMVRAVASVGLMLLLLAVFLVSLLGLVAVVLSIRIGWQRREKREGIVPLDEPGEGMVSDVDLIRRAAGDALDRLADRPSGDPGDAVVQAWLMLEGAAAGCGLARQPHQTPSEFTTAVLAGLDVDASALDRLRGLYQRARFSTHPVTEGDVDTARNALRRVVADLGAPAAAGSAAGSTA
jgi:hypothetical protein